jgi:hypothetical protein
VIIDGKYVVRDHEVVTLDYRAAIAELIEIAARHEAQIQDVDVLRRRAETLAPLSLPWAPRR